MLRPFGVTVFMAASLLGGCATITRGTDQDIAIGTDPQGARCELQRDGKVLALIEKTPRTVKVDKSKNDIEIVCTLEGYETARYLVNAEVAAMAAGNVIFGGAIGLAVDAGSGALNKYESNVTVRMIPVPAVSPEVAPKS